jgi:serine/threonine protein kinase
VFIQYIHSHSYVYSNIKPQNILVRPAISDWPGNQLFFFNFTSTELYRDPKTYAHIPFCSVDRTPPFSDLTSTTFASVNFHSGNRLSRWDDLESLTYLLMYLINSSLPWTDTKVTCNDDILKLKMGVEATGFCDTLSSPCVSFLLYTRQLSFTQKPDYGYILSLFCNFQSKVTPPATRLPPDLKIQQLSYWVEDIMPVLPSVYRNAVKAGMQHTLPPPAAQEVRDHYRHNDRQTDSSFS